MYEDYNSSYDNLLKKAKVPFHNVAAANLNVFLPYLDVLTCGMFSILLYLK
jgi:hypothetical protein